MKHYLIVLTVFFSFALPSFAQNAHGSITGQVTDPSGAVIPRAAVTVTNTDTGAISHVVTSGGGYYTAPELPSGPYKVTVDATGFKTFVREGIQLDAQQNATINIKLTVGQTTETVNVSSDAPLIDLADASTGQVLSTQEVEDLPSNGGSPLGFARIEYGAVSKAKHDLGQALPYNNSTVDDFSLGGGNSSSNELLLNGVPNMQDGGRTAGFSPFLDATSEVRVDVFGANATYGDTSGGTVNITTKSGTNKLHGSLLYRYQESGCSSLITPTFAGRDTDHCTALAGLPYSTKIGNAIPPSAHLNQYGGSIGGPFYIPHLFDGRNKLFFFYAYEGDVGQQPPATTIGTVPTAAERTGDFSALLAIPGANYQLYNPYAATGTTSNFTRAAIPGNILANAGLTVSPIAQAYYKLVPLPNYQGATTTADGQNNYFTFTPSLANYKSHQGRIDYNLSSNNKMWGEAHRSRYLTSASNYFHDALTGTVTDMILSGGLIEDVQTFNPTTFLDIRGSVTRFDNSNYVSSSGISPTSFGFPSYLASNSTAIALPQITFTDATNPLNYSNLPGSFENFDTVMLFTQLTKIHGAHTFLLGADIRAYKGSYVTPGAADGTFGFANSAGNPVSATNTAAPAKFGSSLALFDLGIPTGGSYNVSAPFQYDSWLDGFFLQDNWKARSNITISAGIRFEHETPVVESQNRMANGFNPTAVNEATAPAEANYAKAPNSLLPVASFQPTGGITFASASMRNAYNPAPVYVSPRLGLTWAPEIFKEKLVVRLGYGIYTNPFGDYSQGQTYGYSTTTSYVQSINGGLSIASSIADPFPAASNPIQQPTGNTLGVNTNLGSKVVYYSPVIKVPYSERSSFDIQYQIGAKTLIDIGYLGNHQVHLSYSNAVDSIPLLPYLSRSPYYDIAATNLLTGAAFKNGGPPSTNIPNPFKGVTGVTGSYATTSNLAPNIYLMTNPEFTSVTEQLVPGASSNYNALNARISEKMYHGLTLNGVFEWSRLLGTFNQLNAGDILNYGEDNLRLSLPLLWLRNLPAALRSWTPVLQPEPLSSRSPHRRLPDLGNLPVPLRNADLMGQCHLYRQRLPGFP